MPVRKIKPGRRAVRGFITSPKNNGRQIAYESSLERDFYYLLEMNRKVKAYEEQPIRVTLDLGESTTTYVPDTYVVWYGSDLPTIYEVKPKLSDFPDDKKLAMEKWCQFNGSEFKVIDGLQIKTPEVECAKFLYHYLKAMPSQKVVAAIFGCLSQGNHNSVSEIANQTQCRLGNLYYLIATGQLACEGMPSANSLVTLSEQPE